MQEKYSSVIASSFRYVVIDCIDCFCMFSITPQHHLSVFSVHKLKSLPLFCNFHSFSAVLGQSQMHAKIDTKTKNYHRNFNSLLIISKQLRDDWSLLK